MEKFEELQSLWNQQSEPTPKLNSNEIINDANHKVKKLTTSYYWTIGILSILILLLISYYYSIYNSQIVKQIIGLELMIIVIIVRIILETISVFLFKRVDFVNDFKTYTKQLLFFYKFRRLIHFMVTPIIYTLYILGFISLLPLFKENLSKGFYLYIQFSGFGFLLFFSFMLYKVIRRDLVALDFLKNVTIINKLE